MNNTCALLVTTCDSYSDAWKPFFELLHIMWPGCPYPIYLNTESLDYTRSDFDITVLHPHISTDKKGRPISWSYRLKEALHQISEEYVLFFLEDFFLQKPVRADIVDECIRWMQEDKNVVFIDFYHDQTENDMIYHKEFSEIQRSNDWAINANCALWRKSFLEGILRDEDPWLFEMNATARWRRTKYKIYTHIQNDNPVFAYSFETINGQWSGILKGKWLTFVPPLFEEYGIEVDFTKRGLIDPPDMRPRDREKNWLWHDLKKAIKSPRAMAHYIKCLFNVMKDKMVRFKRRFFNP